MSVTISTFGSSCTIAVGYSNTFSNDASTDISEKVNQLISEVPVGYNTVIDIEPGTYGVGTPILLASNTSVEGYDATLEYLPGIESQTNWGILGNAVQDTQSSSISVEGVTFLISNAHIFGTWFTNAKYIDVQYNTYIGGTDGNAFVSVIDGVVSQNIALGQDNVDYDDWNGPVDDVVEDNIGYVYGAPPSAHNGGSGWDILINSSIANLNYPGDAAAYGISAGDAANDAVVENVLSSNWLGATSVDADALLDHGYTTESNITQQGNITEALGSEPGGIYISGPMDQSVVQDDSFVGPSDDTDNGYEVIDANGNNVPGYQTSGTQITGNLILGLNSQNTLSAILNAGVDLSTVNNAALDETGYSVPATYNQGNGTSVTAAGNITNSGTTVSGSGVIPTMDITAPATLNVPVDTPTSVVDLAVDDITDSNTIFVTLTSDFGTLSLPDSVPDAQYTTILGQPAIVLTGSLSEVNVDLAELSYSSNAAGWDDAVEVNATDADGFSATRYIPVVVGDPESSTDQVTTLTPGEVLPELYYTTVAAESNLSNDTVIASSGNNLINMGSTVSIVFLGAGENTILGGIGAGYIATGSGQALIDLTAGGNMSVAGGSGPITVNAATGNNMIDSGACNAFVQGGSGSNSVVGGLGELTVQGSTGALYIATLPQDGGNLTADLGSGNSTVFALSGNDYVSTQTSTQNFIDLGIGNDCVVSAGSDQIYSGAGDDTIIASNSGSDSIVGGAGTLYFVAGAGSSGPGDYVRGGSGLETVMAGESAMTVQGGTGAMYLDTMPQYGGDLTANLGSGNSTVLASSGNDEIETQSNTENVLDLGDGDDCVVSAGADTIYTGSSNDTIDASAGGADSVIGGAGSLYFIAGEGNSVVDPAAQTTILAGAGNLSIGGGGAVDFLQLKYTPGASRVICIDYPGSEISLSGYGANPIIEQNQSGDTLNVTLSDGTILELLDTASLSAAVLGTTLGLVPWTDISAPVAVNINEFVEASVPADELAGVIITVAATEVPSGMTAIIYSNVPSPGGIVNSGTVVLDPTYLVLEDSLTGDGAIDIDTGSGLELDGSVASTQTIAFTGTIGSLILGDAGEFHGTITGFMGYNTIDLSSVPFSKDGLATIISGNILEVIENGETTAIQLDPTQSYAGNVFDLSSDGLDGTEISDATNFTVPAGANSLSVNASAAETILGNGAANFTAIFAANSTVTFNTNGGNGSIVAGGAGAFLGLTGTAWSVEGAAAGNDTVAVLAPNSLVAVYGAGNSSAAAGTPSNLISIGVNNVSINSFGANDLVESYANGSGEVSVHGTANILVNGGSVTVSALAGSSAVVAFFEDNGGRLTFINNSGAAASVTGAVPGVIGGSVTAFGGVGGGVYAGGPGGNNSLIGGAGLVTLYGGGTGNFLSASSSLAGGNVMFAAGGSTTMVGAAGSGSNLFYASTGSTTAISYGSGAQVFFAGTSGQDIFTGSTVSGATNSYYFLQDSTGAGSDIITNFNVATDTLCINPFGGDSGVSILQIYSNVGAGGGVIVNLSDNTTIKLYGVSLAAVEAVTTPGGLYI